MISHNAKYPVHLEAQVDGDASAGLTFKVFVAGTVADATSTIFAGRNSGGGIAITDIEIVTEAGGLILVVADSDADGKRVCGGVVSAKTGIVKPLQTPHFCPPGVVPKLFGPASGKTRAVLHGYIYRA